MYQRLISRTRTKRTDGHNRHISFQSQEYFPVIISCKDFQESENLCTHLDGLMKEKFQSFDFRDEICQDCKKTTNHSIMVEGCTLPEVLVVLLKPISNRKEALSRNKKVRKKVCGIGHPIFFASLESVHLVTKPVICIEHSGSMIFSSFPS